MRILWSGQTASLPSGGDAEMFMSSWQRCLCLAEVRGLYGCCRHLERIKENMLNGDSTTHQPALVRNVCPYFNEKKFPGNFS